MEQNINPEQNMNTNQGMSNMGTPVPEKTKSTGTTIGIIIILLVLAFGAWYFFNQVSMKNAEPVTENTEQASMAISALSAQGTSTDMADIEKDLNATDLSGIDAAASAIAQQE